ncbi:TfoX/Sxy family protein [Chitinophaga nivalis]|uniref:TfoX/Sxy family protein n=1 Tax=Chitinophaga nivalis TaxID=2991709 RepID=A0ABT3IIA9_9BACT|nr:TfoX/Sxy family protein [Chitinophaga nivalis]MCW3466774.1 TfoX/Sxy family protein [Chitinophaga nivalis]MCW3483535.1 TfoX/Sxy family protein [Chitinophaga nivalis]
MTSYPEQLADRVRALLAAATSAVTEKKMFGGLCFMVHDKMCVGVKPASIMVRIDPSLTDQILENNPECTPMIHGGKTMKGYIFVPATTLQTQKQLQYWIKMALEFNHIAKSSRRK